ncbi:MAG: signal transduction histidine kinase, partial [Flavobacteriales bacterium]
GGNGLHCMKARVEGIGATLLIESSLHKGCEITSKVPA